MKWRLSSRMGTSCYRSGSRRVGSPQVVPAFAAVDQALADMGGAGHSELWTVAALRDAPEWAQVRVLAAAVLRSF